LAPTLPKARVPSAQRWALLLCHRQEQRFVNRLGGLMSQDEEYVHELRVALRRLRSALRIFADVLPQGLLTMRDALREWGRMLSPVRDEDVFLAFLHRHIRRDPSSAPALGPLLACSLAQRDRKLRSARRFFASGAFRERQRQLETMLSQSASGSSGVRPVAKRQVNRRLANVLRFPADLHDRPEEELHRLRIACKRLRYCCEFFEPMKRKVLSELASTAQGMQDSIGEHRDAGLFLQEVQTAPASRSKARRQVIEGVIQALHDRQQRRLADAHRAWQAFGKTRLARKGRVQLGVAGTWDLRQTTLV
jgi:CHAD domain-containing protein